MNEKIKNFIKNYWRGLIIASLALAFFFGVSSYNYLTQADGFVKWASPDETANYVFSKLYGQTGEMTIFEKYNLLAEDMIHPRSFRSDHGVLKPVSFLGIILIYGRIVSLTSDKILPFLTPAVAGLGIVFFYLFIKNIFGRRNGLISAFLLASFPVYIYYSARSMFHNVLFVVLLIIGLYFGLLMARSAKKKQSRHRCAFNGRALVCAALAGGFIGLAIATRTAELLWLAPTLMVAWLFNFKQVGFVRLAVFLSFLFLALLPMFFWNQILYDAPGRGGYPEMNRSIANITSAGGDLLKSTVSGKFSYYQDLLKKIRDNIFYFGFNARQSLKMFYYYFVDMFAWLFWPAVLGFFMFCRQLGRRKRKHWAYFSGLLVAGLILTFYYGSWEFHDNPDPASFTIGNSYTRYWLPIYLGVLPLASMFLIGFTRLLFSGYRNNLSHKSVGGHISSKFSLPALSKFFEKIYVARPRKKFLINGSRIILIALVYFFSIPFVIYGSEEGLYYSLAKSASARQEWRRVLDLTEPGAVIITRYHDKLFFPERKVIVGLFNDDNMNSTYARLAGYLPVYYYNFTFPDEDMDYLNNRKLAAVGLHIEKIEQVTADFSLYRLYK